MKTKSLLHVLVAVAFGAFLAATPATASLPPCNAGTLLGTPVTVPPINPVFQVEGKITDICEGDSTITPGIQGTLTVNGLTFNVPPGLNIDVGDPLCGSGQAIPFGTLDGSHPSIPIGTPSLAGVATGIANGTIVVTPSGSVTHTAGCVFMEESENGIIGIRVDVPPQGPDPGTMLVSNVLVRMETDPRFAPFNSIIDDGGQQLLAAGGMNLIPVGTTVVAEGVYRAGPDGILGTADDFISARLVEAAFIANLGGAGLVAIQRGECRNDTLELRVRGVGQPIGALISLIELVNGVPGQVLVTGVVVDALGEWEFRGIPPAARLCPDVIHAVSNLGADSGPFAMNVTGAAPEPGR